MELPFLKKKRSGGGVLAQVAETSDKTDNQELLNKAGGELMDAIHKKDIGSLREALKAVYHLSKED